MAKKAATTRKVTRDAGTGKFVPEQEGKRRPKSTVKETVPVKKKK